MIYALFIAIDNYPIASHRLNGCVNDATALLTYLENNYDSEELNIKTLFDAQADKASVIASFQHFKAAKDGDTCLFYYSGHGSQAMAPVEFKHIEPDGKLETIVCHDSRLEGGRDLMDKELSFLIWAATQHKDIHFLALFDCCHSGTNTRDVRVKARKANARGDLMAARNFHGYAQYQVKDKAGRKELTPPNGRHVQMSAAKANETAKELRIGQHTRGAFTYNLIALLEQNNGQLTYSQLTSHLRAKVANYVEEQTPQIDALEAADKNRFFLGKAPANSASSYAVNYDKKRNQWFINAGEVHNLPPDKADEIKLRLKVDGKLLSAKITKVDMMQSALANMPELDKNKSYEAMLDKIPVPMLQLAFAPDCQPAAKKVLIQSVKNRPSPYYTLLNNEHEADYWINSQDDALLLTLPGEERPVFRRVKEYTEDSALRFLTNIETVARWHYVKNIQNPKTTLTAKDYSIELYRIEDPRTWETDDDAKAELINIHEELVFNYDYDASKPKGKQWIQPAFRMKVKNTSSRTLFFSAVNLLVDYGIKNKFLPGQQLEPGEEAWLLDRLKSGQTFKCIPLELQDSFLSYGVNEISEYIKIFISTLELDTDGFNQPSLEMDKLDRSRAGRDEANYPPQHDWCVVDVQLKVVRPVYERQIEAGQRTQLANSMEIEMPEGVSCMAMLNAESETSRNLSNAGTPMPDLPSGWTMQNLAKGMTNKPPVNVLELYATEGMEKINADNPIKIQLSQQPAEDEFMLPVAFDHESGLYYPIGIIDDKGMVNIEDLPAPTAVGTRSLGGSIKIFFQKTIGRFIPYVYTHPQLSLGGFEQAAADKKVACGINVSYSLEDSKTKEAIAAAQKIVLFIHGIIGDTSSMPKMLRLIKNTENKPLEEAYDLWLTFDYENLNTPIEETAEAFKAKLKSVGLDTGHNKTFHIVAHSMGGLVSRWFIEKLGGNKVVSHLYMLGTPNQGSPYGSLYEMATPLLALAVNGAAFLKPYVFPLKYVGKFLDKMFYTLKQMNEDSDFLKQLNDGSDPQVSYTIIAGNTQLIPADIQAQHHTLFRKIMARFKSRGHYDALDVLLFKAANDIAAKTEFIREIPGADRWKTPPKTIDVASDHISYFGDSDSLTVIGKEML